MEKESPQVIANGIQKVLEQQHMHSPEKSHRYVHDGYSWGSVAERTNNIYQRVLSEQ